MFNFIAPKLCLKVEKWKWNKEYRVYVSNFGQFKNEHKQPLPIKVNGKGYCLIKTEAGLKLAHRVVMLTWKPIPNAEDLTVDYLDHNKRNNSVDNLEWVTKEENLKRAADDHIHGNLEGEESKNLQPQNLGQHPVIKGGKHSFNSYQEAAQWLIKECDMGNDVVEKNVINRIKNAMQTGQKYGGRKWKVVF